MSFMDEEDGEEEGASIESRPMVVLSIELPLEEEEAGGGGGGGVFAERAANPNFGLAPPNAVPNPNPSPKAAPHVLVGLVVTSLLALRGLAKSISNPIPISIS